MIHFSFLIVDKFILRILSILITYNKISLQTMFLTLTEPPGTLKNLIGFNDSNTIDDKNESTEEEFDIDSHVEDDFPCEPVDPNVRHNFLPLIPYI